MFDDRVLEVRDVRDEDRPLLWPILRDLARERETFAYDPDLTEVAARAMWLRWATRTGFAGMQFNAVVEGNVAAETLYRNLGFVTVGTVPGAFESPTRGRVGLHVMFRPLP